MTTEDMSSIDKRSDRRSYRIIFNIRRLCIDIHDSIETRTLRSFPAFPFFSREGFSPDEHPNSDPRCDPTNGSRALERHLGAPPTTAPPTTAMRRLARLWLVLVLPAATAFVTPRSRLRCPRCLRDSASDSASDSAYSADSADSADSSVPRRPSLWDDASLYYTDVPSLRPSLPSLPSRPSLPSLSSLPSLPSLPSEQDDLFDGWTAPASVGQLSLDPFAAADFFGAGGATAALSPSSSYLRRPAAEWTPEVPKVPKVPKVLPDLDQEVLARKVRAQKEMVRAQKEAPLRVDSCAYFYLATTLNLSDAAMLRITFTYPSLLGQTVDNLKAKVTVLKVRLGLDAQDLKTLLEKSPQVLQLSAQNNLRPTLAFLKETLNLSKSDLRNIVLRTPTVLTYSLDTLHQKLHFFLGNVLPPASTSPDKAPTSLRLNKTQCKKMLLENSSLLRNSVHTCLLPHLRFFAQELHFSPESLRKVVLEQPRLLTYSLQFNLRPKIVGFFMERLDMTFSHVERMMKAFPKILDYSLQDNMLPVAQFFVSDLGYSTMEFRSIMLKCPRIVTYSMDKVHQVVSYLRDDLGMNPRQLKRIFFQQPQIFGLNLSSNLLPKIHFLRTEFDLNPPQLRKVIAGMPTLLGLSVEDNLVPKIEYLRMYARDEEELREVVIIQPTLLGYSLKNRIAPRLLAMGAIDEPFRKIAGTVTLTELKFQKWIKYREEKRQETRGWSME